MPLKVGLTERQVREPRHPHPIGSAAMLPQHRLALLGIGPT